MGSSMKRPRSMLDSRSMRLVSSWGWPRMVSQPSRCRSLPAPQRKASYGGCERTPPKLAGMVLRRAILELLEYYEEHCFPHVVGLSDEIMAYKDFASSAQRALERCVLSLASEAVSTTGQRKVVMSGGVALNCAVNGALSQSGILDELFIQPAATDSGVGYGAALVAAKALYRESFHCPPMVHAYWGLETKNAEISEALDEAHLTYQSLDEDALCRKVAEIICNGGVVGWHQGRAEIGPRALGARSILGNPTSRKTLVKINKIKSREVLAPLGAKYFGALL